MTHGAKWAKAMLLAKLKSSATRQEFEAFFLDDRCGSGVAHDAVSAARCVLMHSSEIAGLPHQVLMADSPAPFDAVYQLTSPDMDSPAILGKGIQQVVEQLNDWIDRSASALFVGAEITITRGDGPIGIIMPLRRRRGMSHDDFMHDWFVRHAALSEDAGGIPYRQNHVDADATRRLCRATGITSEEIDGVTEAFFSTAEEARNAMSQPQVANEAIEDEKRFIDHGRSQFGFYRIARRPVFSRRSLP